jgi:hypothetical protein
MVGTDSWRIPTREGHIVVRDDAFEFRSRPRSLVVGRWRALREAGRRERLRRVGVAAAPPLSLAPSLYGVAGRIGTGLEWHGYAVVACTLFYLLAVVLQFRPDTVDRSEIRSVELDPAARTLSVSHWKDGGVLGWSGGSRRTRELTLPSVDAVREARSVLRLRGVEFETVALPAGDDDGTGAEAEPGTERAG